MATPTSHYIPSTWSQYVAVHEVVITAQAAGFALLSEVTCVLAVWDKVGSTPIASHYEE